MVQGRRRPLCFNCGRCRVPNDQRLFCTIRCAADWAEHHAWNLQDIGINKDGEFEIGYILDEEEG